MKRFFTSALLFLWAFSCVFSQVKVKVCYDGYEISDRNKSRIEDMLDHMSDFYSFLGASDTLDVRLVVFKSQSEGYEYMRQIYPENPRYRRTASDDYFGGGLAGVYMPGRKTAVILGLEKGVDVGMKVIYHEISHHFTHILFGRRVPPVWFNEGLAEYFEHSSYSKKKGWMADFSDFDKGKLRSMLMMGELDVKAFLDLSQSDFIKINRTEGQTYYSFAYAVFYVLYNGLDKEMFGEFVRNLKCRKTDVSVASLVDMVYTGGFASFEKSLYEFIQ